VTTELTRLARTFDSPKRWRRRAEEAWAIAENFGDEQTRRMMRVMERDELGRRAEQRRQTRRERRIGRAA
jgi:hypothetical protein